MVGSWSNLRKAQHWHHCLGRTELLVVWYTLVYFTTNHYNEISLVIHVVLFFSVPPTTNDKNLCPLQVYGIIQWFSRGFLDHSWTTLDFDFFFESSKSSTRFIGCLLFRATKWSHPSDHKSDGQVSKSLMVKGWRIPAWCLWCSSTAGGLSAYHLKPLVNDMLMIITPIKIS